MALTKEEKKALKEAKRLAKLAAEEEFRKKLKRDQLKREMAAQAKKKLMVDKTLRELMLKIKAPTFRQDIEIMCNTFDRAVDRKDKVIKYTMKLMDIADDQYRRTIASFCVTIDKTINKFLQDLSDLSRENDIRTANLLELGRKEAARIMKDHNAAETHLQLMIYHGHSTADSAAWTARGEFFVKEDEDRTKYSDERELLRSLLEDKYNSVWDEYKATLKAYVIATANNQKQVRRLRLKENMMADIIASQAKKIANSGDMLKRLRNDLSAYESGTKQAGFRERRNRHRTACYNLKKRLKNGCALDEKQLLILVKATDTTLAWLAKGAKKGEKVIRLAALCRKFESLREKIMPYGCTIPHSPTALEKSNIRENQLVFNAISSTSGLTRLWQRIAKVELTKCALYREKMLLIEENSYLCSKLQEMTENNIEPETHKCKCRVTTKKIPINPPTAIEGALELNKYRYY